MRDLTSCPLINDVLDLRFLCCAFARLFGWRRRIGCCFRLHPHLRVNLFVWVTLLWGCTAYETINITGDMNYSITRFIGEICSQRSPFSSVRNKGIDTCGKSLGESDKSSIVISSYPLVALRPWVQWVEILSLPSQSSACSAFPRISRFLFHRCQGRPWRLCLPGCSPPTNT